MKWFCLILLSIRPFTIDDLPSYLKRHLVLDLKLYFGYKQNTFYLFFILVNYSLYEGFSTVIGFLTTLLEITLKSNKDVSYLEKLIKYILHHVNIIFLTFYPFIIFLFQEVFFLIVQINVYVKFTREIKKSM